MPHVESANPPYIEQHLEESGPHDNPAKGAFPQLFDERNPMHRHTGVSVIGDQLYFQYIFPKDR